MLFYISMTCDNCGEDMFIGPIGTTLEHNDKPVVPFDIAAQETFTCECGAQFVTGDFDYMNAKDL